MLRKMKKAFKVVALFEEEEKQGPFLVTLINTYIYSSNLVHSVSFFLPKKNFTLVSRINSMVTHIPILPRNISRYISIFISHLLIIFKCYSNLMIIILENIHYRIV